MSSESSKDDGKAKGSDTMDLASLFRGTATVSFVVMLVTTVMFLGSGAAFVIDRSGLLDILQIDVAIFLLLVGGMITLFFFLGAISFFVRVNRRIGRIVFWESSGPVDLNKPGVKSVVIIYGLAIGLLLIMGIYGYYLIWKYFFAEPAATSLSVFGMAVSLGGLMLAILVQLVVLVIGRTASKVVRTVLAENDA